MYKLQDGEFWGWIKPGVLSSGWKQFENTPLVCRPAYDSAHVLICRKGEHAELISDDHHMFQCPVCLITKMDAFDVAILTHSKKWRKDHEVSHQEQR